MKSDILACLLILSFCACDDSENPPRTAADAYTGTYTQAQGRWSESIFSQGTIVSFGGPTMLTLSRNGTYTLRLVLDGIPNEPSRSYSYSESGKYDCLSSRLDQSGPTGMNVWYGILAFSPAGKQTWSSDFSVSDQAPVLLSLPATFVMPDSSLLIVHNWMR